MGNDHCHSLLCPRGCVVAIKHQCCLPISDETPVLHGPCPKVWDGYQIWGKLYSSHMWVHKWKGGERLRWRKAFSRNGAIKTNSTIKAYWQHIINDLFLYDIHWRYKLVYKQQWPFPLSKCKSFQTPKHVQRGHLQHNFFDLWLLFILHQKRHSIWPLPDKTQTR